MVSDGFLLHDFGHCFDITFILVNWNLCSSSIPIPVGCLEHGGYAYDCFDDHFNQSWVGRFATLSVRPSNCYFAF